MRMIFVLCTLALATSALELESPHPLQAQSALADLEPWETPIESFFIRNHHDVPILDPDRWEVEINGLVEKPIKLSLSELKKFPQKSFHAVLECSGNGRGFHSPRVAGIQWRTGAVGNAQWTGASLSEILKRARVKKEAKFIRIEGADKPALPSVPVFVRSIPLNKAMEHDTLLAWDMNRVRMPLLHGGPLRLILPRWYGQNWIKWVTRITVMDREDDGFYMKTGYRMPKASLKPGQAWDASTGDAIETLRVQTLLVKPLPGTIISVGKAQIEGKAFSGAGTISKVELSTDSGSTWAVAQLEAPRPRGGWQSFSYNADFPNPGTYTVLSRATDSAGNTQPLELEWNPSGYLRNNIDKLEVEVRDANWAATSNLVTDKCLTCHAVEMIRTQKLTSEQWTKILSKMQKFGAQISDDEKNHLTIFLPEFAGQEIQAVRERVDFALQTERFTPQREKNGDISHGKTLFNTHCAVCHGKSGEGKIGPRLLGRAVPRDAFFSMVQEGRGNMPSYATVLSAKDIAAIRNFVQRAER